MNISSLTQEILGLAKVDIAGWYKAITTDTWDPNLDSAQRLKAVHLECDKKVEQRAKKSLSHLYGSQSVAFPLGIRMRLVAEYKDVKVNARSI